MSIRIEWDNNEEIVDVIKIFRSTTPFTRDTLPESPIAVLPDTATDFTDTVVPKNTPLYYMIVKYRGEDYTSSPLRQYADFPYTGMGPSEIRQGDWRAGYFGEVSPQELFGGREFLEYVKLVVEDRGLPFPRTLDDKTNVNEDLRWQKFVYNGKILFIPLYGVSAGSSVVGSVGGQHLNDHPYATWGDLYKAGLIHGYDGDGEVIPNGVIPTNQLTIMRKSNMRFILRTIRLTDNDPGVSIPEVGNNFNTLKNAGAFKGGEVWNTLFRMFNLYKNEDMVATQRGEDDYRGLSFAAEEFFESDLRNTRTTLEKINVASNIYRPTENIDIVNDQNMFQYRTSSSGRYPGFNYNYGFEKANFLFPFAELSINNYVFYSGSTLRADPRVILDNLYRTNNVNLPNAHLSYHLNTSGAYVYSYPQNWVPVLELIYDWE